MLLKLVQIQIFANTGSNNSEGEPECTFRAAIQVANNYNSTLHESIFNIPVSDPNCLSFENNNTTGYDPDAVEVNCLAANADPDITWWRIEPTTLLPDMARDQYQDATTQTGYIANTQPFPKPLNGQNVIEISCDTLSPCITVSGYGSDVSLQGFVVNSSGDTIVKSIDSIAGGPYFSSSLLGTDISGTRRKGSNTYAVDVERSSFSMATWLIGNEGGRNIAVADDAVITSTGYSRIHILEGFLGALGDGSIINTQNVIQVENQLELRIMNTLITGGDTNGGIYFKSSPYVSNASLYVVGGIFKSNIHGINFEETPRGRIFSSTFEDNVNDGIHIQSGTSPITISASEFFNNGDLAIDLGADGVTVNDAGDSDTGVNNFQNFPELVAFIENDSDLYIEGTFDSLPGNYYRLEFFSNSEIDSSGYGEGEVYLGYVDTPDDSGSFDFSSTPAVLSGVSLEDNQYTITSTATNCGTSPCTIMNELGTSEYSGPAYNRALTVNSTGDSTDTMPGDGFCLTGNTNPDGSPECTLRAAIEESNDYAGFNSIDFDIPISDSGCRSFENNYDVNYDHNKSEVSCQAWNADPDFSWWKIEPSTLLPAIDDDIYINGSTQNGFRANTNTPPNMLNGQPVIEISCTGLYACIYANPYGFSSSVDELSISNLVINSASDYNVLSLLTRNGTTNITGTYIGTDISGKVYKPGTFAGVYVWYGNNVNIGGSTPDTRNLIVSDNYALFGKDQMVADAFNVYGNIIGMLNDGSTIINSTAAIGIDHDRGSNIGDNTANGRNIIAGGNNGEGGVSLWCTGRNTKIRKNIFTKNERAIALWCVEDTIISNNIIEESSGNAIGCRGICDQVTIKNNTIRFNNASGISSSLWTNSTFSNNKIYSNTGLGIDLEGGIEDSYGVTENDTGDGDTGSNNLQNFPTIDKVTFMYNEKYLIEGNLDNDQSGEGPFEIEICESDNDNSKHGECIRSLGKTSASSPWNITVTIPGSNGLDSISFSSLATNSEGATSEFSKNFVTSKNNPNYFIPPIAIDDVVSTNLNTTRNIDVLANDSDADGSLDTSSLKITSQPSSGSASIENGKIKYTPISGFVGTDSFEYEICDNDSLCDTATVTINVGSFEVTVTIIPTPTGTATISPTVAPSKVTEVTPTDAETIVTLPETGGEENSSFLELLLSTSLLTPALFSIGLAGFIFPTTLMNYLRFLLQALPWAKKKKDTSPWGIVYDQKNKQAIPFASVKLSLGKTFIEESITDMKGRYTFASTKGVYELSVVHPDFKPFIQTVTIDPEKPVLLDIALRSNLLKGFDLSRFRIKLRTKLAPVLSKFNTAIFTIGFLYALGITFYYQTVFNFVILAIYIAVLIYLLIQVSKRKWGYVYDKKSKKRIVGAFVRVFSKKETRQVDVQMTAEKGTYKFILPHGEYVLRATKSGLDNTGEKEQKEVKINNEEKQPSNVNFGIDSSKDNFESIKSPFGN